MIIWYYIMILMYDVCTLYNNQIISYHFISYQIESYLWTRTISYRMRWSIIIIIINIIIIIMILMILSCYVFILLTYV